MRVGNDQADARQTAGHERAHERKPASAVLAGHEVHPQDLPEPRGVHPGGDHDRDVHDPAALTNLLGERVEPEVGVRAGVERARTDGLDRS